MSSDNSDHQYKSSGNLIPDRVVRFYGNVDYALECIAFKEITFIHQEKMNDPFDPWLEVRTQFNNYYDMLAWEIENKNQAHIDQFKQLISADSFNAAFKTIKTNAETIRKGYYIFSTCAHTQENPPENNLYMWGHYANGHRGIAIEFDAHRLNAGQKNNSSDGDSLTKMCYGNDLPIISYEIMDDYLMSYGKNKERIFEILSLTMRTKNTVWMPENEWRLVSQNNETELGILRIPLPDKAITQVFIGCETSKSVENKIVKETKKQHPHTRIFRAIKCKDRMALEFEEL